ncbi:MAG: type II toxin-antitoxin system VapB family antitoxin [Dehalococcoidia bacterium]
MRTTLDLDRRLLDEVTEMTGEKSKSRAVNKALEEFVRRKKIEELRKAIREGRFRDIEDNWYELRHMEPR